MTPRNQDDRVVEEFGREWSRFDQTEASRHELQKLFDAYFSVFDWGRLPENARGFDLGCGSGRWASFVASRVGSLHCIDPSRSALEVARANLAHHRNCNFHLAGVGEIPLEDESMDFGYSLGVLHHVPDTLEGIRCCVEKLKRGAPLLLYLYYAFDNRPPWYRLVWKGSDLLRRAVSRLPYAIKYSISQAFALIVYFPLSRIASTVERLGQNPENIPLAAYRDKSFYTMRTDALDRLGTRLERRFTRQQVAEMMSAAGLGAIRFSDRPPYWCVVGYRLGVRSRPDPN